MICTPISRQTCRMMSLTRSRSLFSGWHLHLVRRAYREGRHGRAMISGIAWCGSACFALRAVSRDLETPMNVIPVIIYAAELAVAAIILFYVIEMLTMPANMKRVCQGLIVLIAILSV